MQVCHACSLRRKKFPRSIALENGEYLFGNICKACDRKFIMLDYYTNKIMPEYCNEVKLRGMVQNYDQKLQWAKQEMKEENRVFGLLQNAQNDNSLKLMKAKQKND